MEANKNKTALFIHNYSQYIQTSYWCRILHTGRKLTNASSALYGMLSDQSKTTKKQNKIAPHISLLVSWKDKRKSVNSKEFLSDIHILLNYCLTREMRTYNLCQTTKRQNHRNVEIGRDLWRSSISKSMSRQGHHGTGSQDVGLSCF